MKKIKLLYLSSITPSKLCGADLAIYRHLVLKEDFEVAVASVNAQNTIVKNRFYVRTFRILLIIKKIGFIKVFANIEYVINWMFLAPGLLNFSKSYKPDIIFTVPDIFHTGYAFLLAKKLNIPLVVDFQDLTPLSHFFSKNTAPYNWVRKFLIKKYHFLHSKADLVFYTSEGMKMYFDEHKNGHILYPLGDFGRPVIEVKQNVNKPIEIIYAGNCYGAYGRMLLRFANLVKHSQDIRLKIYPVGKGWSDQEINEMTDAGIYQSFKPFEELKKDFERADAFLTVMSFEDPEKPFVKTSFTTKWLDYAPYGKPIFVWSPEYASSSIFAKKYNCGVVVEIDNEELLKSAVTDLANNPIKWNYYGEQAKKVSNDALNAEKIHHIFKTQIDKLIK